jgi:hypothetical protein
MWLRASPQTEGRNEVIQAINGDNTFHPSQYNKHKRVVQTFTMFNVGETNSNSGSTLLRAAFPSHRILIDCEL